MSACRLPFHYFRIDIFKESLSARLMALEIFCRKTRKYFEIGLYTECTNLVQNSIWGWPCQYSSPSAEVAVDVKYDGMPLM